MKKIKHSNEVTVESLQRAGVGFSPESGRTDRVGEIYVMITWQCNLRCRMCPMWGDRGFCRSLGAGEETLDVETLVSFIGDALDLDMRSVTISGGEQDESAGHWPQRAFFRGAGPASICIITSDGRDAAMRNGSRAAVEAFLHATWNHKFINVFPVMHL